MDFIIKTYHRLLITLINQGFSFQTFQEFLEKPVNKSIVLRHDVDKLPENSLQFAQIQNKLGIKGSYYFRIVPESFNPEIIKQIAELGHEIGFHYEDIEMAVKSMKNEKLIMKNEEELANKAIKLFEKHLAELRKYYPVKTICMHGSPLSKFDNKLIWEHYNYRDFGIIGEPYFDVDFSKVLYLTDTGRRWDGDRVSIRDKISHNEQLIINNYKFKSTSYIIQAAKENQLPDKIMFTFHPQRWTDKSIPWIKELVWQNMKNTIKKIVIKTRK